MRVKIRVAFSDDAVLALLIGLLLIWDIAWAWAIVSDMWR